MPRSFLTLTPHLTNNDMEEMKKTSASWSIELTTDCPHCEAYIDIIALDDFDKSVLPTPLYSGDGLDIDVKCPQCNKEFIINGTTY